MSHYQLLKWIHIISASGLLASGIAGLVMILNINQPNHEKLRAQLLPKVLLISGALVMLFALIQVLTGFAIISIKQEATQTWAILTWILFFIIGILYLLALFCQLQCNQIINNNHRNDNYKQFYRFSIGLTGPITLTLIVMYFLMSNQPT